MAYNDRNVTIEDARIVLRNFAGKVGKFNAKGQRNFGVLLDDDVADELAKNGWLIKRFKPSEEQPEGQAWIKVHLKYRDKEGNAVKPPRVVLITSRGRNPLDEETAEMVDFVDIRTVDLIIRPYDWRTDDGGFGTKAMLKSIFVTVEEDELDEKYADYEEVGADD